MGWLILVAVAAAAMGLLVALDVPRVLWSFVCAALMLGAAGYALQGSPTLAGAAADPRAAMPPDEPELIALRDAMLGRYTLDAAYLTAADAMNASGNDKAAVQVLLGGVGKLPRSYALWTALGTAYARHDGGQASPPARFAFQQARRLAPELPAPLFFEGLALARTGDLAAVRPLWVRALQLTPPAISYRQEIAVRLAILDQMIAMQQAAPQPR